MYTLCWQKKEEPSKKKRYKFPASKRRLEGNKDNAFILDGSQLKKPPTNRCTASIENLFSSRNEFRVFLRSEIFAVLWGVCSVTFLATLLLYIHTRLHACICTLQCCNAYMHTPHAHMGGGVEKEWLPPPPPPTPTATRCKRCWRVKNVGVNARKIQNKIRSGMPEISSITSAFEKKTHEKKTRFWRSKIPTKNEEKKNVAIF